MTRKFMTAAAILGFATTAYAMTDLDTDGDNMLTMAELQAVYPDFSDAQFTDADADGDGMINEAELTAARAIGIIPPSQG